MKRWLAALIVFRVLTLVAMACGGSLRADADAYRSLSENLYTNGVFGCGEIPTAYRPPLYPILLLPAVAAERVTGCPAAADAVIVFLHASLAAVTIAGTWRLAGLIFRPRSVSDRPAGFDPPDAAARWVPPVAATLVAIDPILVQQAGLVMTETAATALAVLLLIAGNPLRETNYGEYCGRVGAGKGGVRAVLTGLLYGAVVLCRPAFLPPAILATLLFAGSAMAAMRGGTMNGTRGGRWRPAAMWGCFVAAMLLPIGVWTVRNVVVFHTPIVTTTHGGYTLLLGNNADCDAWLRGRRRRPWDAENFQRELAREFPATGGIPAGMPDPTGLRECLMATRGADLVIVGSTADAVGEVEMDRAMRRRAIAWMRANPAATGRATAARIARFWGVMPMAGENESPWKFAARCGVAVFYSAVGTLTLIGLGVGIFHAVAAHRRRDGRCPGRRRAIDIRVLLCASLVLTTAAIHTVYWTDMRMRSVIAPVLAIVAAYGFVTLRNLRGTLRRDGEPV